MAYKNAVIYYWSGTGNTLQVCRWIHDALKAQVPAVTFSSIHDADPAGEIGHGKDSLAVIAMPTHGFTAPWKIIRFCLLLPRRKKTDAVTVANGGGTYPGFYLPGCAASANLVISLILLAKGYRIRGCVDIDMPGSWPAFCPALNEEHIGHFLTQAKVKTEAFINTIASGRRQIITARNVVDLIIGLPLIPLSFGYLLYGKFFLAKLQFANYNCTSCGLCAEICSNKAIKMKGKGRRRKPYWTFKCESCGRCISYCPLQAVETGHGMAILIGLATKMKIYFYLFDYLIESPALALLIKNKYALIVRNYAGYLLIIFLCYHLFYRILKIPFINRFFAFTSGTHWWSRYHEPSVKIKDFGV